MAQTYEIDIQRFNGTDYDKLLPTPAKHASTHKADGTDPLVCQTGNYGDKTVTGAKMADGAVETAKIKAEAVTMAKIAEGATRTTATVTLTAAGWSNNTQTVNVSSVKADSTVIVSPAPESFKAYGEAGIYCSAQAEGKLTFTCENVPTAALTVNVVIPR